MCFIDTTTTSHDHTMLALASDTVVMPRMVYDIWPYFVPFYPLYSNIFYPTLNAATVQLNTLNEVMTNLPQVVTTSQK